GSPHWITDGREKYVWFSGTGQEQLFDLTTDPQELHDLMRTPEGEARVRRWREALVRELTGREEGFSDGERLVPGRPVKPVLEAAGR
ncbi:MAG: arylsulfatase, partial [Armatimonadetes bacterium]|nr:arylsulfatase [Armatimonadota bacterium]